MIQFIIASVICLFGYVFHTVTHYFEHKGREINLPHIFFEIVIFAGYAAWFHMVFSDPFKIEFSHGYYIGMVIGVIGLLMFILSVISKKGFREEKHLVTKGIYSKIRNPMYLGTILMHIGFPLVFGSMLTLASAVLWIPQIFLWRFWEEQDLEKRFGEEYIRYKKRTLF